MYNRLDFKSILLTQMTITFQLGSVFLDTQKYKVLEVRLSLHQLITEHTAIYEYTSEEELHPSSNHEPFFCFHITVRKYLQ